MPRDADFKQPLCADVDGFSLHAAVRNIYGATKTAAEDLYQLMHQLTRLPMVVLRTSRFFPEDNDDPSARARRSQENIQLNELLYRRVVIEDVVDAICWRCAKPPALA